MTPARTQAPPPEPLPVPKVDRAAPGESPVADLRMRPTVSQQEEAGWCPQDIVEEWGLQSFPASDAPANW